MRTGIYCLYDTLAEQVIGGLQLHKAEAAAVRVFDDLARDPQTGVGRHTKDYNLLFLGWLEEDNCITSPDQDHESTIVITGKQWLAINKPDTELDEPPIGTPHPKGPANGQIRSR